MKYLIPAIPAMLLSLALSSQQIAIVPQPVDVKMGTGYLTIKQPVGFIYNDDVTHDYGVSFFKDYLKKFYNISKFKQGTEHSYGYPTEIFIELVKNYPKKGGYEIEINKNDISITGDEVGIFYAFQTLIQLLPVQPQGTLRIPCITIKDYPRFAYRGMHLDVGRHFFPVSFVKKYIDYLALHKFNTFHWHLTEDQGWRIEIKKYPRLTEVGAWRNGTIIGRYPGKGNDGKPYGGFYTQDEVKEIVKYASERFIEVIPEIEMPGHSSAAIAAYPELSCFPNESTKHPPQCAWAGDTTGKQVQQTWGVFNDVFCAGKENTFSFMQDVIDEVITLFPSKYIHVGGDECPKENWKRCPNCQQRIKDNNLKNEHELQSYFIQRMEKYINAKGKTLIGWDEILEGGLAPNAVVMSWTGEEGGIKAAKQKHKVIMTPNQYVYLNYSQTRNEDSVTIGGYLPLEKVYNYEPLPHDLSDEDINYVLGSQGNLWTEYIGNEGIAQYMLFPRLSALSEVLWSPKEKRDYKDFEKRLPSLFKRYDLWKVHYSRAYFDLKALVVPTADHNGVLWKLEKQNADEHIVYSAGNGGKSRSNYVAPIKIKLPEYSAALVDKNGTVRGNWISQKFHLNKATGKDITLTGPPSTKYSGDGAFTLVNGVQNEKGLERSSEFLGFEGPDCEAIIDLGSNQTINSVKIHTLSSGGSWVYPPQYAEVFVSLDGKSFTSAGKSEKFDATNGLNGVVTVNPGAVSTRYLKVFIKNFGLIPSGMSGAGNNAWLFVDEIEVL